MAKFYVKWWLEPSKVPVDAEQRVKGWLSMLEMIKADMNAGVTKDWGMAVGGECGYTISEAANEAELFTRLLKYIPYAHFEVVSVLTVDQTIESIKKAVAAAQK
ncbi:hypothetical protein KEJ43_06745 [Candidatus Bathyarchaeota archaeon]|nr:hypothetical protein [Candidatus Bathyarchaeota archaeon]